MTYETIQTLLTASINIIAIAGMTGIIAHAFYTHHKNSHQPYCPPVVPFEPEVSEAIAPEPYRLSCPIDPDAYWDTQSPDGSSWEYASPLTCEWTAPYSQPSRRGRPKKQQPGNAQHSTTRKRKTA